MVPPENAPISEYAVVPALPANPPGPQSRPAINKPKAVEAKPPVSLRRLELPAIEESIWKRGLYLLLGMATAVAFFLVVLRYFAPGPGTPGIDENAYLVAGKNMARTLSPGLHPSTPYAFVGPMWIRTSEGWFYPKYPAGIPLLNAIAIWLGGGHNNLTACYVSPVCAALAILAMFLLTRMIAGSFLALLATMALATNSTLLQLALVPSSHAPDICFVLWGMYALLCWWKTDKLWVGIAAGFLLGYAVTIRYSEGLLLLPLGVITLLMLRWTNWRAYLRAGAPILAWAFPVVTLVVFNRISSGHWTGYDSTHESTGFTLAEFKSKWEFTIQEIYQYGLFLLMPLGVLGMLLMFERTWRLGLYMILWFVPSLLLYMAYYWGTQAPGVGYLRFFLTLFPPVIASAMWLIGIVGRGLLLRQEPGRQPIISSGSFAIPLGIGIFMAGVTSVGMYVALPDMERQYMHNTRLVFTADTFLQNVPAARHQSGKPDPIFFADDSGFISATIMYLQFVGDGEWYTTEAFTPRGAGRGMMAGRFGGQRQGGQTADQDAPVLIDPQRIAFTQELYAKMSQADLTREQTNLLNSAADIGRPIYAVVTPASATELKHQLAGEGFDCTMLTMWMEPSDQMAATDSTNTRGGPGGPPGGPGGPQGGNRRGGGRGFPGGHNVGGLGPPPQGMQLGGDPQKLQLLKITRKMAAPTSQPTS